MAKSICRRKREQQKKKLKAIDNKLNEIKTCIKKLEDIENKIQNKNKKPFSKLLTISKDDMDKLEEKEKKRS